MFFSRTWQDRLVAYIRANPEIVRIRFSLPVDDRWWVVAINWVRDFLGLRPWIANDKREECARTIYLTLTTPQNDPEPFDAEPF